MSLPADWITGAVGTFAPVSEDDTLFDASGTYPDLGVPGLRVLVAKPHCLLGMKLMALSSLDRGDRGMEDARMPALELRIADVDALRRLYASIHGGRPTAELLASFASVLA